MEYSSASTAHPRSRGENRLRPCTSTTRRGSSPLTRGKRWRWSSTWRWVRLIPAHAGKTLPGAGGCEGPPAHPRSRGENLKCGCFAVATLGSSPLTRGKPSSPSHARQARGLIPAHAGKTSCSWGILYQLWAHPRSRGENTGEIEDAVREAGSSPLTRGKRCLADVGDLGVRLIPAHAGKTGEGAGKGGDRRAHPRSRGENSRTDPIMEVMPGSSPLTRGKPPLI